MNKPITWTPALDEKLTLLWPDQSRTVTQLAMVLGVGETGLRTRVHKLGLDMRGRRDTPWTDERVAMLRKLHAQTNPVLSMTAIGHKLGVTKSTIIGKVHRLKLPLRRKAGAAGKPGPKPKTTAERDRRADLPAKPALAPAVIRIEPPVVPSAPITILTVRDGQCRWPIDPEPSAHMRLCGAQVAEMAYCAAHARIAHQPVQARHRAASRRSGGANG